MTLPYIDVNPPGDVNLLVIWLHGLGDSGHGFAPVVPELKLPENHGIRFVFPHAPVRPVTINNGFEMRSWYDIKSMDMDKRADENDVRESAKQVEELIEQERAKHQLDMNQVVLAGFSQGGVVTLHLAPRLTSSLAGIMGLSTYMCSPHKLIDESTAANVNTPVFMGHGLHDDVVPMAAGEQARKALQEAGYTVDWNSYPMQHNVCAPQLLDISRWLQSLTS